MAIHYKQGMSGKERGNDKPVRQYRHIPPGGVAYAHIMSASKVIPLYHRRKSPARIRTSLKQVIENEAGDFIYISPACA